MSSFFQHPKNAYLPIGQFPEYQNFVYNFDYITIVSILTFIFFMPSVYSFVQMTIFYEKNVSRNFSKEIHPFVFKTFLHMQGCGIIYTILDFFLYRIPSTSIVTSYFSTIRGDSIIRYVVAVFYGFDYLSQLFTVLFCFIRVLVLYNPRKHLEICKWIFVIWSITSYVLSFVASIPHITNEAMGLQLDIPFQYGSMFLTTTFAYGNVQGLQTIGGFIFSFLVTIAIIVMTSMMMKKLKSLKFMTRNSARKAKSETTLTITMFVILIPALLTQVLAFSSIFANQFAGYLILIRPILLDCRVNIVSCYFYWTYPYFRKNTISHSVTVRSLSSNVVA
ncbi:unnamed protein product [Caenorhabditis nigoni]